MGNTILFRRRGEHFPRDLAVFWQYVTASGDFPAPGVPLQLWKDAELCWIVL
jgi:hypothetical protein